MVAIVLAGGQGTRLRGVLEPNVPKTLAPIGDTPFLYLLLLRIVGHGFREVIISCGYLADEIERALSSYPFTQLPLTLRTVREPSDALLGTGGATLFASSGIVDEDIVVMNGDTYSLLNLTGLVEKHRNSGADISIAVRRVKNANRYGSIDLDGNGRIRGFHPYGISGPAFVNSGTYVFQRKVLEDFPKRLPLSLECDVLPELLAQGLHLQGYTWSGYFIDIGVPSDYEHFNMDVRNKKSILMG